MTPRGEAAEARIHIENLVQMAQAPRLDEDDLLRLHLISEHAVGGLVEDPDEHHDHEHFGPGGIRNHPWDDRTVNLEKVIAVLHEAWEQG